MIADDGRQGGGNDRLVQRGKEHAPAIKGADDEQHPAVAEPQHRLAGPTRDHRRLLAAGRNGAVVQKGLVVELASKFPFLLSRVL